jgi:DNA-binding transcriptional ArsR family regulator
LEIFLSLSVVSIFSAPQKSLPSCSSTSPIIHVIIRELISHPGLRIYIFKLSGTLTYTLTISNKPLHYFELSDANFEDVLLQTKEKSSVVPIGLDASAVGAALKIVKNDRVVDLNFEGRDGSTAVWKFDGLTEVRERAKMYATASVQTVSAAMVEIGVQTQFQTSIDKQVQNKALPPSEHAISQTMMTGVDIEVLLEACGEEKAVVSTNDRSSQINIVTLQSAISPM